MHRYPFVDDWKWQILNELFLFLLFFQCSREIAWTGDKTELRWLVPQKSPCLSTWVWRQQQDGYRPCVVSFMRNPWQPSFLFYWHRLPRKVVESLSVEESKSHEDVALRDVVIGYGGGGLGLVIWEVCLNLKDSVIPLLPSTQFWPSPLFCSSSHFFSALCPGRWV